MNCVDVWLEGLKEPQLRQVIKYLLRSENATVLYNRLEVIKKSIDLSDEINKGAYR